MYDFDLVILQISLLKATFKKLILAMGCQMHYGWAACHPRFQGHICLAYYHKISNEKWSVEYYGHLMTKDILQSKEEDIASTERHLKYVQSTFLLKHVTRFQQRLIQISATTWQKSGFGFIARVRKVSELIGLRYFFVHFSQYLPQMKESHAGLEGYDGE